MMEQLTRSGNEAAALGAKLSRAEVIAAYPITPSTFIVEYLAQYIADGELKAKLINVESEHSAMSACIGASLAGARTFTATSSQGLALMHEMLHWAVGARTPVVMAVGNRALAPPWNLYANHQDSIAQRDTGWIEFYCENNQEVLDTIIQAYKVAEDKRVLLPAMVCLDGFILTHTRERVDVPPQDAVDEYLPPYRPEHFVIDFDRPLTENVIVTPAWYMEYQYQLEVAMRNAREVIREANRDFAKKFNRDWGGLVDSYFMEDAEVAIMAMGTIAGTARVAVREMRKAGHKVGLIKLRAFRPFPIEEIRKLGSQLKVLAVIDRNCVFGSGGASCIEAQSALYSIPNRPKVLGFIAGLGGKDVGVESIKYILNKALKVSETGRVEREVEWVNLVGGE
ncbi:pyruvate ferredoxin oxidoreductase [Candidatus Bathyarchaeota archaeon]|nr:pyruvate ferredoxin oxidoreductase [Candidatus Bathyarchaeota archaeon]